MSLDANDPRALMAAAAASAAQASATPMQNVPMGHFPAAPVPVANPSATPVAETVPPPSAVLAIAPAAELPPVPVMPTILSYIGIDAQQVVQVFGHTGSTIEALMPLAGITYLAVDPAIEMHCKTGRWQWIEGALAPSTVSDIPFPVSKARAILAIDEQAEQVRLSFITAGAGQAMVYQAKRDEAQRFLALYPTSAEAAGCVPSDWPFLNAEIDITAPSLWLVAQTVLYLATSWTEIAAAIEIKRLTAKAQVQAAPDEATIKSVMAGLSWPSVA